jgi:hypothetical protein
MYIIHGNDCTKLRTVQAILKVKGIEHRIQAGPIFSLETNHSKLIYLENIIRYLDDRFPVPQLITGEIPHRAVLVELVHHIGTDPRIVEQLVTKADPFINGKHISILDILAYVHTRNQPYKQFMEEVINAT